MQLLEDRIRKDGKVREGNVLKVDSFLNHQMDVNLFREIGKEFQRRFAGEEITKILTIEASGIGIACVVAEIFNVPVVFAKKTQTKNIAGDVYTTKVESFTHGRVYDIIVSKEFLGKGDKVLLIDDFLANGKALEGLATLVQPIPRTATIRCFISRADIVFFSRVRLTCKAFSSMYSVVPHSAMQSCSVVTRASPPDKRATNSFP